MSQHETPWWKTALACTAAVATVYFTAPPVVSGVADLYKETKDALFRHIPNVNLSHWRVAANDAPIKDNQAQYRYDA